MEVHNWTLVDAGIFHDFHVAWITHLKEALKKLLSAGYYALAELAEGEALTILETTPKVDRTSVSSGLKKGQRRTLTIRHISGHRIIALVETGVRRPPFSVGKNSIKTSANPAICQCWRTRAWEQWEKILSCQGQDSANESHGQDGILSHGYRDYTIKDQHPGSKVHSHPLHRFSASGCGTARFGQTSTIMLLLAIP
jgi:hypothetical protein